jgi:hypothetical protein
MARHGIREMKRLLRAGACAQASQSQRQVAEVAALELLERSVRMRHRRLAVQRLNEAIALGAQVPKEHLAYCRAAAAASRDNVVQALFARCERMALGVAPCVVEEHHCG